MAAITATGGHADRSNRLFVAAIAFLLMSMMVPVLLQPSEFLADDSYFYLQIAANIIEGLGSTFHGITPTNGYHPLWMAGAVLSVFLAGGSRMATLHVTVMLQIVLSLAAALLFLRLARGFGMAYGAVGTAVIVVYLFTTGVFGSEAHLNVVVLIAGMRSLSLALDDDRSWRWFVTGLLFGLAMLARLDNVFVVAAICGFGILYGGDFGQMIRRAAAGLIGGMLVLLPYLAYNLANFGHAVPISGMIKSTFPTFDFDIGRLGPVGELAAACGVTTLVIGLWLDTAPRRRVLWLGLGTGVLLHAFYVSGFTDHYTFWAWYYVPGVIAGALIAAWFPGWLADRLHSGSYRAGLRVLAYSFTIAILMMGSGRSWLKAYGPLRLAPLNAEIRINEYRWPEEFAADWMKIHLPPGSRVFVFDWPGAFAWYSGLPILPMDGLVNDFRYNDELLAAGAQHYLCAHDIEYYLGLHDPQNSSTQVVVTAPLDRKVAGVLSFHKDDLVVRVRDVVSQPDRTLPFALWRLRCPRTDSPAGSGT